MEINLTCLLGLHEWVSKGHTLRYKTSYGPDISLTDQHLIIYVECAVCKKRTVQGDKKNWNAYGQMHKGIQLAKIQWVGSRIITQTYEEEEYQKKKVDKSPTS